MASSGSKKYHWTDVQLYALGLAGQNASNQDKTTDVQLGMEIANTYKQHLQRALADMLVSWEDVHAYSMDDLVQVRTALAPVTLWNKFKDLQKKGKCLTAHYGRRSRRSRRRPTMGMALLCSLRSPPVHHLSVAPLMV